MASKTTMIPITPGTDLSVIVSIAQQQLQTQGYDVTAMGINPASATLTVTKDRDGLKNIIGLGVECRATLSIMNGTSLTVNIDSEWTNKIVAMAVGWFLCWIPFITGIVGALEQNKLPEKISTAIQIASTSNGQPTGGFQPNYQAGFQPQQPQNPTYQNNYPPQA